jgi:mannitol-1-phosphate 5-dehydrogenase
VECFNRILISRIGFEAEGGSPDFQRGITVFEEKPDLLPFEEAKLYGHNSTHALAAYIGAIRSVERIADLAEQPGVMAFLEAAFIGESGATLIRRHSGVDALFTPAGYRVYALDLLNRMFNPYLGDTVSRVGRDPARKLEWQDRLIGTIRVALRHGVPAPRYAMGAAAALAVLEPSVLGLQTPITECLDPLWSKSSPDPAEKKAVLAMIEQGLRKLRLWREAGFPHLESYING